MVHKRRLEHSVRVDEPSQKAAASALSNRPECGIDARTLGAGAAAGKRKYVCSPDQPATARDDNPIDDPTGSGQRGSDGQEGQTDHGAEEAGFLRIRQSNPQGIAFFSAETPAPATPAEPLPQDVFTNRFDLKGQDPGAVMVVLFDSLAGNAEVVRAWQNFQANVNAAGARRAEQNKINRAETTTEAFTMIADHVAAIPGRKSLVWVSGSFTLRISIEAPNGRDSEIRNLAERAARTLNRANMSIYPVDATGVTLDASMSANHQSFTPPSGMASVRSNLEAERMLADTTGGQAFYGSNDIVAAMRRSFDDARYAYTIGFYPNHAQWHGEYRRIIVHTKAQGAQLRYRKGYFADSEETTDDERKAQAAMQQAAMSPLDATSLGMVVNAKPSAAPADHKVELHVRLDPKQLLMQQAGNHQKGAVELVLPAAEHEGRDRCGGQAAHRSEPGRPTE
jgi:hypothetical protein